jgi:hypothetical protein
VSIVPHYPPQRCAPHTGYIYVIAASLSGEVFYGVHAGAAIYFDLARYFSAIGAAFGYANAAVSRSDNRCSSS